MKETPAQYKKRIMGILGKRSPIAIQRATPTKLARLMRGLTAAVMRRRPAPKKWSIGEIVAHLSETELVAGYRMRTILSASGTPIQAFDQDKWAVNGLYAKRNAKESLEVFSTLRAWNLSLLTSLPRKHWNRYGMHAERGKETIRRVVEMMAGHDLNHLGQIEKIVGKRGARG